MWVEAHLSGSTVQQEFPELIHFAEIEGGQLQSLWPNFNGILQRLMCWINAGFQLFRAWRWWRLLICLRGLVGTLDGPRSSAAIALRSFTAIEIDRADIISFAYSCTRAQCLLVETFHSMPTISLTIADGSQAWGKKQVINYFFFIAAVCGCCLGCVMCNCYGTEHQDMNMRDK